MAKSKAPELNGGKKVIEFMLDSGVVCHVEPLSIYIRKALRDKAEKLFPSPDKKEYEKPVDPERAVFPDEVIPAEQNPDYREAMRRVNVERSEWQTDQFIMLAVHFPAGKEALIEQYAEEVARLAGILDLPDDPWEATLKFCLIRSEQDRLNIVNAANSNLLLTEGEVRDGLRMFRPGVRPNGNHGTTGTQRPSNVAQEEPLPAEHDV